MFMPWMRWTVLVASILVPVQSFILSPAWTRTRFQRAWASSPRDDDSTDDIRRLLEASWNAESMGVVPTNPESAAEAAATCLRSAMDKGQSLFFVDLLLPAYDLSQGPHFYDEVLAVEFCIALADAMGEDECEILVRDEKALKSVSRAIMMRERERLDNESLLDNEDDEDEVEFEGEGEKATTIETYDDFADFGSVGAPSIESPDVSNDVDLFRKKLMTNWDVPIADSPTEVKDIKQESKETAIPRKQVSLKLDEPKMYRLATMFGDAALSAGPDMFDQVIKAVKENGKPKDNEDTIIILSATSKEEMIAVRSLVGTYKSSKTIVLVNCKLDPLPRELIGVETVYSIISLVAKPSESERNVFESNASKKLDPYAPKVVVMRRFPRDWEVFVDANGSGFELADTAVASQVSKKGPPMEWIAGCVKRYLQRRLG